MPRPCGARCRRESDHISTPPRRGTFRDGLVNRLLLLSLCPNDSNVWRFPSTGRAGGAILGSGDLGLTDCIFTGNQAAVGPAVSNTVTVTLSSTTLAENTLTCDDDGLFLDWKKVRDCNAPDQTRLRDTLHVSSKARLCDAYRCHRRDASTEVIYVVCR